MVIYPGQRGRVEFDCDDGASLAQEPLNHCSADATPPSRHHVGTVHARPCLLSTSLSFHEVSFLLDSVTESLPTTVETVKRTARADRCRRYSHSSRSPVIAASAHGEIWSTCEMRHESVFGAAQLASLAVDEPTRQRSAVPLLRRSVAQRDAGGKDNYFTAEGN